jgi:hypothetical protein
MFAKQSTPNKNTSFNQEQSLDSDALSQSSRTSVEDKTELNAKSNAYKKKAPNTEAQRDCISMEPFSFPISSDVKLQLSKNINALYNTKGGRISIGFIGGSIVII